jgi:CheY-specific phosphatase CheX
MKSEQKELLSKVFCDALEKLAFMFGEPAEMDELSPTGNKYLTAGMTFTGDMSGEISITVSEEMCIEIAANILGVNPDDKQAMNLGIDSFKEVLNVTCGQALTAIAGEKVLFNLSIPQVSELDASGWTEMMNKAETIGFLVDDYPVLLSFSLLE